MFITDPDTPTNDQPTDQAGAAAASAAADPPPQDAPPPSREDDEAAAIAKMDEGLASLEAASGNDAPPPADDKPDGEGDGESDGESDDKGDKPDKDGKPAPDKAAGEQGKPDPKPDADAQAEASKLGLSGKASERFVAMSAEIKELRPIKEALDKAGIKDLADVPALAGRAKAADDMIAMVMDTGANEEQYGKTLDYLTQVNLAMKGDRAAAEKAFASIEEEYLELAKALGKEVAGHDPLAEFPDLAAEVKDGDLPRTRAVEIASQRRHAALSQQAQQQAAQHQQATQAQVQAQQQGVTALGQWEADKIADPAYLAIRNELSVEVAAIRQKFPPQQWVAATEYAYRALIAQKAAAAPPPQQRRPAPSAMRPGAPGNGLTPQKFASGEEAIGAAIDSM